MVRDSQALRLMLTTESAKKPSDTNAGVKTDRVNITCAQASQQTRQIAASPASPKHGSESNSLSCPSLARTTINAARASGASWSNALVANMVTVQSVCVYALP